MITYNDLVQYYNAVCATANEALAKATKLEKEVATLRKELQIAYNQISDLKFQKENK